MNFSQQDMDIMYSIYMNDSTITYQDISSLYKNKYLDINETIVGNLVRKMDSSHDPIIDFNNKKECPIYYVKSASDTQKNRNSQK